MEIRCVRVKLKPDSFEQVQDWANTMNLKRDEALETMRDEGMLIESTFLEHTSEGDYLIVFMMAEDFEKAKQVGRHSTRPIDEMHREFRKAVSQGKESLELLVDFNRVGESARE